MKMNIKTIAVLTIGASTVLMMSCSSDPNSPGHEYFPDMYRSPAVEAYVDYGQDPWGFDMEDIEAQRMQTERLAAMTPPAGTIPFSMDPSKAIFNFPYPYPNTEAGYALAGEENRNPIEWSEEVVAQGGEIFNRMCVHCHGETGAGDGTVIKNSSQGYAVPNDFSGDKMMALNEGHMFHSLQFGKGMGMGSHASQLTKEERWMIIHYIRTEFQGKDPDSHNWTSGGDEAAADEPAAEEVVEETP